MDSRKSFEQQCTGERGFSCDETSMLKLTKKESFNELVTKLTTKCEAKLLFLRSPTNDVNTFTLDIVACSSTVSVASAWQTCEKHGYDGLNVLAFLDLNNIPKNSDSKYSFSQFINSLIHNMESYFMFQKYNDKFVLNAVKLWDAVQESPMKSCSVVIVWKCDHKPIEDILSRSPSKQLNSSPTGRYVRTEVSKSNTNNNILTPDKKSTGSRRKTLTAKEISTPATPVTPTRRRRGSEGAIPAKRLASEDSDDDHEISFKKNPAAIIPQITYLKDMSPKTPPAVAEPVETEVPEPMKVDDITLGFEKAEVKKRGRQSTGRKSLIPEWPNEDKDQILHFFDNMNPSKAEQTRVALTCKFAQIQFEREMPSKLLYQWIQKKGRPINRTITNYEVPEIQHNTAALDLYKELNTETSETTRVAFICKFVNLQYGITLTSKEFYNLLNGKGKKTGKR